MEKYTSWAEILESPLLREAKFVPSLDRLEVSSDALFTSGEFEDFVKLEKELSAFISSDARALFWKELENAHPSKAPLWRRNIEEIENQLTVELLWKLQGE